MRSLWKDITSTALTALGAVVVFAKLQSYSWWLIGSWKGALGVIAVLGIGILLTNIGQLIELADIPAFLEIFLWTIAGTVVIGCLSVTTTKAEFVASAAVIGVTWLVQVTSHLWNFGHHRGSGYAPVH